MTASLNSSRLTMSVNSEKDLEGLRKVGRVVARYKSVILVPEQKEARAKAPEAHRNGEFMKVQMNWTDATRQLNLRLGQGSRMLPPNRRAIEVRIAGQSATRQSIFEGRPLQLRL